MKTKLSLSVLLALCIVASAIMPAFAGVTVGGGSNKDKKDTAKRTTTGGTADNLASQTEVEDIFNYALDGSATITAVTEWDGSSPLQTRGWWGSDKIPDLDPDDMPDWLKRLGDAEDEFENHASRDEVFAPFTDASRLMWAIETISEKQNINAPYVLVIANTTWNDVVAVIACDGDEDEKPDCYVTLWWNSEMSKFSVGPKGETIESVLGTAQQYKAGED